MFQLLKNKKGMSLLEVTIAGAIAMGIGLAVIKLSNVSMKGANKVKTDTELLDLTNYIKMTLGKAGNCALSLNNAGYTTVAGATGLASFDLVKFSEWDAAAVPPQYTFDPANVLTFTADGTTPIEKAPNWKVDSVDILPIDDVTVDISGNSSGICRLEMQLNRGEFTDPDSKRSYGARSIIIGFDLSCNVDPIDPTRINYCVSGTTSRVGFWRLSGGTPNEGIEFDYDITVGQNVIIGQHVVVQSDERIKRDISELQESVQNLSTLKGYRYKLKDSPEAPQLGLMAQEVEKTFPEAVYEKKDGTKGVRYTMLIPVLIQAINEQQEQLKKQEKIINEFKTKAD